MNVNIGIDTISEWTFTLLSYDRLNSGPSCFEHCHGDEGNVGHDLRIKTRFGIVNIRT